MQVRLKTDTHLQRKTSARNRGSKSAATTSTVPVAPTPFQNLLEEVLPAHQTETRELQELWLELPEVEKNLLDHPSNANLERYRALVFQIARDVMEKNVRSKQVYRNRKNSHGERIQLTLLEFVNQKLRKMAEAILNPELPAFYLLRTTSEIRGALLDYRQ